MIITLVNEFGKKKLDFKSGNSGSHLLKIQTWISIQHFFDIRIQIRIRSNILIRRPGLGWKPVSISGRN